MTEQITQLDEILFLEKIIKDMQGLAEVEVLAHSRKANENLPIYQLSFGSKDPKAPVLGLIGGVHGLERIGSQVTLALLKSFCELLLWDHGMHQLLQNIRVFFIPTVNPLGILHRTRSNPNGIDLMRNSPVEGIGKQPFLIGGHRISPKLMWFRGQAGQPMEVEAEALVKAVLKTIDQSSAAITVDFHSGFGLRDQIWFPYAKTTEAFPDLALMHSFKDLMEKTYPYHFYTIEPQARNYTTHGDLWDYIYDIHRDRTANQARYLPLCLEMGSWMWIKKNPLQVFQKTGLFNPLKAHRLQRTLRRHNTFFEFLLRAVNSPAAWADLSAEQIAKHQSRAKELWYGSP